jgi:hypothetical protein
LAVQLGRLIQLALLVKAKGALNQKPGIHENLKSAMTTRP